MAIVPACAQRSSSSDFSFRKAVEAYYEEEDQDKTLELVNNVLDDSPNHLDARFRRSKIYWNNDKYADAAKDYQIAAKLARKDNPERVQSFMFDYAQA